MKKILFGTGLVMFGAVLTIVGCGGSTPETQGGDNQSPSSEEVKLGETPETSGKSGDEKTGVSCSYVQYCQAPGYYGTVCIYTSGCDADTSYAECLREVRALCGTPPVYPADPFYHQ